MRKGKSSIASTNLLAQKICSNYFFNICYHAGGSTERLPRPKVKRRNEESSPSDALTPKKIGRKIERKKLHCYNESVGSNNLFWSNYLFTFVMQLVLLNICVG